MYPASTELSYPAAIILVGVVALAKRMAAPVSVTHEHFIAVEREALAR